MAGYYETISQNNPYWFMEDDIFTAENKDRNRRIWGQENASYDALGLPLGTRSFKELLNPGTLWDETTKLARADLDQAVTTWLPQNWDFTGKAVEQSRAQAELGRQLASKYGGEVVEKLANGQPLDRVINEMADNPATQRGIKQIAGELAEKAAKGDFKPSAGRVAASVAKQGAGKLLQTTGGIVMPALEFVDDTRNGINPLEAGWRTISENLAGYAGGALGGAAGAATGPGAIATGLLGAVGGSMLMDKVNDFIFGDEDKRKAEYRQGEQQRKAEAQALKDQRLRNAYQGYLANQYLNPYQYTPFQPEDVIGSNRDLVDYTY